MQRIVLASGSARRREILEMLGLTFEVKASEFDESRVKCEEPVELVEELALQKALEVAKGESDAVVVGGDTVVSFDGEVIGKAGSEIEAKGILRKLSGKKHEALTGVAVVNTLTGEKVVGHEKAIVEFREIGEEELERYVQDGHWRGFAGCYAIQGGASRFVQSWEGVFSAIIGMPVVLTVELLESVGCVVEGEPEEVEEMIKERKVGISEEGFDIG